MQHSLRQLSRLVDRRLSRHSLGGTNDIAIARADTRAGTPFQYDVFGFWPDHELTHLFSFTVKDDVLVDELLTQFMSDNCPFRVREAWSDRGLLQPLRNVWMERPFALYRSQTLRLKVSGHSLELFDSATGSGEFDRTVVRGFTCEKLPLLPVYRLSLQLKNGRQIAVTSRLRFSFYRDVWSQDSKWCEELIGTIMRELW